MKSEFVTFATKLAKAIVNEMANGRDFGRVKKLAAVGEALQELSRQVGDGSPSLPKSVPPFGSSAHASAKARGKQARETWVAARQEDGYSLTHLRGVLYEGTRGTVGVAYSSEAPNRSGYFFLGLPNEKLAVAVLLCESKGRMRDLVLPPSFLAKHLKKFSRSQDQVKFNLRVRSTGAVELQIPGPGWVSVTSMLSDYSALR